jgi:hypothetical protein
MADLDDFGIVSIDTALTSQFKLTRSLSQGDVVLTEAGLFHHACAFNEEVMFEAEGYGDLPSDFGLASAGPTVSGLSGGVSLVDTAGQSQRTGNPNEWSASGEHAPDAVAAA